MARCSKCGASGVFLCVNSVGLCDRCQAESLNKLAEEKRNRQRSANLDACLRKNARPSVQRIFDQFIEKYPKAHITGISVQDDGNKLLVYLEGKPMYYATFNLLTGSIDLVSYQDVVAKSAAEAENEKRRVAEANKERARGQDAGCAIFIALLGALYGLVCLTFSYIGGLVGIVCSLVVFSGGLAKSRTIVIVGGVLSLVSIVFGFPYTLLFLVFGILYICLGTGM